MAPCIARVHVWCYQALTATAATDCLAISLDASLARSMLTKEMQTELFDRCPEVRARFGSSSHAHGRRSILIGRGHAQVAARACGGYTAGDFVADRIIGSGAFGAVAAVRHAMNNERFALKRIPRDLLDQVASRRISQRISRRISSAILRRSQSRVRTCSVSARRSLRRAIRSCAASLARASSRRSNLHHYIGTTSLHQMHTTEPS